MDPPPAEKSHETAEREASTSNIPAGCTPETSETPRVSVEEEHIQAGEPPLTWHDVALSIAAELMAKVREDVRVQLGYSTSAVSFVSLCSITGS